MKRYILFLILSISIIFIGCNDEDIDVPVVKEEIIIKFDTTNITIKINDSTLLPISYTGIKLSDITFSMNKEGIISLDEDVIEGLKDGEVRVFATYKNDPTITDNMVIYVVDTSNKETPVEENMGVIDLFTPTNILPINGEAKVLINNLDELKDKDNSNYTWTLNNDNISIDESNIIKANKIGETILTVTSKSDSNIYGKLKFIISSEFDLVKETNGVREGALILYSDNPTGIINAGETLDLKIDGVSDNSEYIWKCLGNDTATVNYQGKVMAYSSGRTTIGAFEKDTYKVKGMYTITVVGENKVDYATKLVNIALAEEGYIEGYDNDTKYGDWYGLNNAAWCAMFVSWCANEAGIPKTVIVNYASVKLGMEWFISQGVFKYKENYIPKTGDLIFFTLFNASHTGIVVRCDGKRVYTIEGNTSNKVAQRSYDINYYQISGYAVPNYPIIGESK